MHPLSLAVAALLASALPAQLTASFSATPTTGPTPLIVTFTDGSTTTDPGGITSWAWDFDGDSVIDSTVQNPLWAYVGCGNYTVSLTVTDAGHAPVTLVRPAFIRTGTSIATLTNGNTSFGAGAGTYLDVNVLHPKGILICGLDTKTTAANGTPITVEVYWTPGTYVGATTNAAVWRLIATGTGTGTGSLQPPVPVDLASPFYLPFGSHGLFIRLVSGGGPQYTQGANTFANNDLAITTGASQSTPFVSALATPRSWNGVFYYSTAATGVDAAYGLFGTGCAGSLATATQHATSLPRLGSNAVVDFDNLPVSVGLVLLGLSNTSSPFGPLPIDLTVLGAPGCSGRVRPDVRLLLVGSGNAATWTLPIPNQPALLSLQFYAQGVVIDPGTNALSAVFSDAAAGLIGQ